MLGLARISHGHAIIPKRMFKPEDACLDLIEMLLGLAMSGGHFQSSTSDYQLFRDG